MAIEIKQLIIRAVVEERRDRVPASPGAAPRGPGRAAAELARRAAPPANAGLDRQALETVIEECTRRVLRELERGRGR